MGDEQKYPVVGFRITAAMSDEIDRYAESLAASSPHRAVARAEVLRELLARGLAEVTRSRGRKRSA